MRFIFPAILIAASIGLFVAYTNPTYKALADLRKEQAAYDEALTNSKELLDVRQELSDKYNTLTEAERVSLAKLVPDNVDNIRLLLDIGSIAKRYGMAPKDVRFDTPDTKTIVGQPISPEEAGSALAGYGNFDMEFSVTGTYTNFLAFTHDLEKSLRVIDITSVALSSASVNSTVYKYTFKIRTYWLRN